MMTIVINGGSGPLHEIEWHIGEKIPEIWQSKAVPGFPIKPRRIVTDIYADGDELAHIKKTFTNLPMTDRKVIRWSGDFARFIFDNLLPGAK